MSDIKEKLYKFEENHNDDDYEKGRIIEWIIN